MTLTPESWRDRLVNQAVIVGASNLVLLARAVLLVPFLTRALPLEAYGAWAEAGATVALILLIGPLGLDNAAVRFLSRGYGVRDVGHEYSAAALGALVWTAVVASLLALVAVPAAEVLNLQPASVLSWAALAGWASVAERFAILHFRLAFRMGTYAAFQITSSLIEIAVLIAFTYVLRWGAEGAVAGLAASRISIAVVGMAVARRHLRLMPPNLAALRGFLGFGLPWVGVGLLTWILNLSDRYLIGGLLGAADVAIYSVAYAVGQVIAVPFAPLLAMYPSTLAGLWHDGERARCVQLLRAGVQHTLAVGVVLLLLAIVWSEAIVHVIASVAYVQAAPLVGVVGAGFVLYYMSNFAEIGLGLLQEQRKVLYVYAVAAAANVAVNLLLLQRLGIAGAAFATLVAYAVQCVGTFSMVAGEMRLVPPVRALAVLAVSSVLLYAALSITTSLTLPLALVSQFAAIVVYLIVMFRMGLLERRYLGPLLQVVRRSS